MVRVLLASFCLIVCGIIWVVMCLSTDLLKSFPPDTPLAERILTGIKYGVRGDVLVLSTILCTASALSQYGARHAIRRIMEEEEPNPRGGVRWMRALQSMLIAWGLWYATLLYHYAIGCE